MEKENHNFYSFFNKYSDLGDYGFLSGIWSRVLIKIFPEYISPDSIEHIINFKPELTYTELKTTTAWKQIQSDSQLKYDLELAIISLCSKILAFGLDKDVKEKFDFLNINYSVLIKLHKECHDLKNTSSQKTYQLINESTDLFNTLRKRKNEIGTSLQLTYKTKVVCKYLRRLNNLISLNFDLNNDQAWNALINEYRVELKDHRSILSYLKSHWDLLLLQIVERTSSKGEKYIAENHKEYVTFFKKSLKGGLLISFFAIIKMLVDNQKFGDFTNTVAFSINYAMCFIMVKWIGGVIATKQPAMTASTIAKTIDGENNLEINKVKPIVDLLKSTSKSQLASFAGNILLALPTAGLILLGFSTFGYQIIPSDYKAEVLINNLNPTNLYNTYFAAIAGVFLVLSGLFSGYIDNKLFFTKSEARIKQLKLLKKIFKPHQLTKISSYTVKHLGAFMGNILLGVLLGSAFIIGEYSAIPFDIRHVAFSASYLGMLVFDQQIGLTFALYLFAGVALVGFINFIVSFSITFLITTKTRGITKNQSSKTLRLLIKEIIQRPLDFIISRKPKA